MWPFSRTKWEDKGSAINEDELSMIWESFYHPQDINLKDDVFRAIPDKDFEYLMEMKRRPSPPYKDGVYDCDDFVTDCLSDLHLAWLDLADTNEALAVGYASGVIEKEEDNQKVYSKHAFIWTINDQRQLVFYEPQTNKRLKHRVVSIDRVSS